jgi:hypothetical protein
MDGKVAVVQHVDRRVGRHPDVRHAMSRSREAFVIVMK